MGIITIRKRCLTYVDAAVNVCSGVFRELLPTPSSVLALARLYVNLRTGSATQQRVDPIVIIMYNVNLAPILVPRRSMIITFWSAEFCSIALASAMPVSSVALVYQRMIVIVLSLMYSLRIHGTHIHVVGSWQGSQQERPSWYYFRLQWTRSCVGGSVSATRTLPGVPVLPAFVPRSVPLARSLWWS